MKLGTLFQDGAVFQRRISIPVWGATDGNCPLKANFAGVEIWGRSAFDGSFMMRFPPMEAGGPYTLTISNMRTGDKAEISDVLVCEVWLASGQSNMAYKIGTDWARSPMPPSGERVNMLQNKEYSSLKLEPERFRYISVPVSQTGAMEGTFKGAWHRITPGTAANVSAVAAWFGYYVKERLDVPVGLVITAYGGSTVETWTSRSRAWPPLPKARSWHRRKPKGCLFAAGFLSWHPMTRGKLPGCWRKGIICSVWGPAAEIRTCARLWSFRRP